MKALYLLLFVLYFLPTGCSKKEEETEEARVKTPVETTTVQRDTFILSKTFKGVTHYLTNGEIKSPIAGYITKLYVKIGDHVKKGSPLFGLETKEAFVLRGKNYLNDPDLKNIGHTILRAPEEGIMTLVQGEENEYILEGELLGSFVAPDMFVFLIEVPFEQDESIKIGKSCTITLPNGKNISGKISRTLAIADSLSQTESYTVVPDKKMALPANLQLTITFIDYQKNNAQALPKEAVLSDETQMEFWVMKVYNDSIAIKTPVKIGLQNENKIEILEPVFSANDKILTKGNYGLSDTAYVEIKKSENAE